MTPSVRTEVVQLEEYLNHERTRLLDRADDIISIWPDARELLEVLSEYDGGFRVRTIPDASMQVLADTREIWLSVAALECISREASLYQLRTNSYLSHSGWSKAYRSTVIEAAYLSYALHELYHICQGIGDFSHVQQIKNATGTTLIGKLDLESSFVAAKVIAILHSMENRNPFATIEESFIDSFQSIWIEAGGIKHSAFPVNENDGKVHRFFGYLVMSHFAATAGRNGTDLPFQTSLWPEWDPTRDFLLLFDTRSRLWCPPIATHRDLFGATLVAITQGNVEQGLHSIELLLGT